MSPEIWAALATVVTAIASGVFGWLRVNDKRKVLSIQHELRTAAKKLEHLEQGERRCQEDLVAIRADLGIRDGQRREERERFQDEITRQERERHKLTVELNTALVDKVVLLERINNPEHQSRKRAT